MNNNKSFLLKIRFIKESLGADLRIQLKEEWGSSHSNNRIAIREHLATKESQYFNRQQLAQLYDLNWIPECSGFVSISHCKLSGGYTFSNLAHGFDIEELTRISVPVLKRTSQETEIHSAPRPEFLWCAKEAGFKAHSTAKTYIVGTAPLLVTDFITHGWSSHFENQIFGFRLKSEKTLDFLHNQGYIFSEGPFVFGIYFK